MMLFKSIRAKLHKTATRLSFYLRQTVSYFQNLAEVIATPPALWIFFGLICLTANIAFLTAPVILFLCASIFIGYGLIQIYRKTHNDLQAIKNATTVEEFRSPLYTQAKKIARLEGQVETLVESIRTKKWSMSREEEPEPRISLMTRIQQFDVLKRRDSSSDNPETSSDSQTEQVFLSMRQN